MKNEEQKFEASEYPEDIAGAIAYKLYDGAIDTKRVDEIRHDLINAITYLKATAENEYNPDYFRTMYQALEDLKNEIEDDIPWWDRED